MKRIGKFLTIFAVAMTLLPINARAAELLIPVGKIVGLQLSDNTVTVAAFDDVLGAEARTAGLKIGDEIVQIDTTTIDCTEDVRRALEGCDGDAELIVRRGNRRCTVTVPTRQSDSGPRLGVYLRQGIAGIGTITFYDPDTHRFGALGHGVSGLDGTQLLMLQSGYLVRASVAAERHGEHGYRHRGTSAEHAAGRLRRDEAGLERRTAAHRLRRRHPHRRSRHFVHSQRRYATGVFCGNSENLSKRQDRRAKSAAEGDGRNAAGSHGGHCAGHVRKPHFAGRQAGRRRDPCAGERSDYGVRDFY